MLMTRVRWILIVLLLASAFLPASANTGAVGLLVGELPVVIAILHFAAWTRWSTALVGFAIVYAVAYTSEFIGTHTGLIFGSYEYSPTAIGPLVGLVPVLLPLAYFSMGYAAYVVVRTILGNARRRLGAWELVFTALLSALVMTFIDIVSDPIGSTLKGSWTWLDGGAYFGVPTENFYGWVGTTFVFFVLLSLWLNRPAHVALIARPRHRTFWVEAIALYGSFGLTVFLNPFLGGTGEIHDAMSMLAALVMTVPMLAAAMNVRQDWSTAASK